MGHGETEAGPAPRHGRIRRSATGFTIAGSRVWWAPAVRFADAVRRAHVTICGSVSRSSSASAAVPIERGGQKNMRRRIADNSDNPAGTRNSRR